MPRLGPINHALRDRLSGGIPRKDVRREPQRVSAARNDPHRPTPAPSLQQLSCPPHRAAPPRRRPCRIPWFFGGRGWERRRTEEHRGGNAAYKVCTGGGSGEAPRARLAEDNPAGGAPAPQDSWLIPRRCLPGTACVAVRVAWAVGGKSALGCSDSGRWFQSAFRYLLTSGSCSETANRLTEEIVTPKKRATSAPE